MNAIEQAKRKYEKQRKRFEKWQLKKGMPVGFHTLEKPLLIDPEEAVKELEPVASVALPEIAPEPIPEPPKEKKMNDGTFRIAVQVGGMDQVFSYRVRNLAGQLNSAQQKPEWFAQALHDLLTKQFGKTERL